MIEDLVMELLTQVKSLDGRSVKPTPARADELSRFERLHGLRLPDDLTAWLERCNGAAVKPGGLYSLFSRGRGVSMDWHLREFPEWKRRGWIPIAGDGCGDVYVIATRVVIPSSGAHPVCFLDQADFERLDFAVASGLWRFLYFLLESQVLSDRSREIYWPFNKEAVLAQDPSLAECHEVPLPWELESA